MSEERTTSLTSRRKALLVVLGYAAIVFLLGFVVGRRSVSVDTLPAVALRSGMASVAIILQPADCATNTRSLEWWGAVASEGTVGVTALIVTDSPVESRAAVRDARLSFPAASIRHSQVARFVRGLGYQSTPLVVLADDLGRVRAVSPMNAFRTEDSVRAFVANP